MDYARLIWLIFATIRIGLWTQVTTENASLFVSLLVLFPEFLGSTFHPRSAAMAAWDKLVRAEPILKAPVQLDEPAHYYWILTGERYVHGMMDGEAITFQNDNIKD
jgi:hypothetical protein